MNIVDLVIAVPLLYFGFRGAMNGIVKEVLNIVGLLLAVYLTFTYMDALSGVLAPLFEEKNPYIPFLSGTILFIGTLLVVALIGYLLKKTLEAANLSTMNRVLGLCFGVLKSGIAVSSLLLLLAGFNFPDKEARDTSFLYKYVIQIGPFTYNTIAAIAPGASSYTETIQEILKEYNPVENLPIIDN